MPDEDLIYDKIDTPLFHLIGEAADSLGVEAYVVGGYVRDLFLYRPSKDIDIVSVGRGIGLRPIRHSTGQEGRYRAGVRRCPPREL